MSITRFWRRPGSYNESTNDISKIRSTVQTELSKHQLGVLNQTKLRQEIELLMNTMETSLTDNLNSAKSEIHTMKQSITGIHQNINANILKAVGRNTAALTNLKEFRDAFGNNFKWSVFEEDYNGNIRDIFKQMNENVAALTAMQGLKEEIKTMVEDKVHELEEQFDVVNTSRLADITSVRDDIKVTIVDLTLTEGLQGSLKHISFRGIKFLSGYVIIPVATPLQEICELPIGHTYVLYYGFGVLKRSDRVKMPFWFSNEGNKLMIEARLLPGDTCFFNNVIGV